MRRARATLESAVERLDREGLGDSYDGAVARAYHLFSLAFLGDWQEVILAAEREAARPLRNVFNEIIFLGMRVRGLAVTGRLDDADRALATLARRMVDVPRCRLQASLLMPAIVT